MQIQVILELEWAYTRRLVEGIRAYARARPDWSLVWKRELGETPETDDVAVIGMFRNQAMVDAVKTAGMPAVNVSGRLEQAALPRVMPDQHAIGRVVAEHLLERGCRNFAFLLEDDGEYMHHRLDGFEMALAEAGQVCRRIPNAGLAALARALADMPRPFGLMLPLDDLAPATMSACRRAGLAIPADVAMVGVNNDDVFCELTDVPLSSVDPDAPRVGYEAAQLLDDLLQGRAVEGRLIAPRGVVVRESSDAFMLADGVLSAAALFIRRNACDAITVDDIVRHVGVSRRSLEQRFKCQFDRTLFEEIRRVQLATAAKLLEETDLPVAEVGRRCGLPYANRFSGVFRDAFGKPPGQYRNDRRLR